MMASCKVYMCKKSRDSSCGSGPQCDRCRKPTSPHHSCDQPACDRCMLKKLSCDRIALAPSCESYDCGSSFLCEKPSCDYSFCAPFPYKRRHICDQPICKRPSCDRLPSRTSSCDDCDYPPLFCDRRPSCERHVCKTPSCGSAFGCSTPVPCSGTNCGSIPCGSKTCNHKPPSRKSSCSGFFGYSTPLPCSATSCDRVPSCERHVCRKSSCSSSNGCSTPLPACNSFPCGGKPSCGHIILQRASCDGRFTSSCRLRLSSTSCKLTGDRCCGDDTAICWHNRGCGRPRPPTLADKLYSFVDSICRFCRDPFCYQLIKSAVFCFVGVKLYNDIARRLAPKCCRRKPVKRLKGC